MYSESAVDRVRFLFRFLLRSLSYLFPKRAAVGPVKPDELVLPRVKRHQLAFRPPGVNERQADRDYFVRFADCTRQVATSNGFVGW